MGYALKKLKIHIQITFLVSNIYYIPIMTDLAPFNLSPQEPGSSAYVQLKTWIEELSSYEHELTMKIASLLQMARKQYTRATNATSATNAMLRHYKTLLSDIRQIKEMFEGQRYDIASDNPSERPSKRVAR